MDLHTDERGMLLVIALPMAALIVGCMFYVVSVGDAILHRERLQDAADATAFEGAVLHARAMNAEVALNLASASLAGVRELAAAAGSAPPNELTPRLRACAEVIRDTQLALRVVAPRLATAEATRNNTAVYRALAAADGSIALSHAALPATEALVADARSPWLLASGHARPDAPRGLPFEPSVPGDLAAPLAIARGAENGNALLQIWSVARRARPKREAADELGMSLVSPTHPVDITPKNSAFAQAEYYFDCSGSWKTCAADAAWSPRWTARLRRFERPDGERSPELTRQLARAFAAASDQLDPALHEGGEHAKRARDYVHALFDESPCGASSCLH